jgi:multidrug efflux pump subunit AcrB
MSAIMWMRICSPCCRRSPTGSSCYPVYQQHVVVDESTNGFLVNLAMSVAIVVLVLGTLHGPSGGGCGRNVTLLLTVVGTLLFMALFSIEMERISLGALIIAMGMLVDNAIVVAEGMQIAMLRGKVLARCRGRSGRKNPDPSAWRHRDRHHGLCRHRP